MEKSLKKTADRMAKIKGSVKGDALNLHMSYVREKEGEEGLKRLETKLEELGYPLSFDGINKFQWYPISQSDLLIVVSKEIFNWTERDVFKMGYEAPKYSLILKLLFQYTLSVEKMFKAASTFWKKYFDFGDLEAVEIGKNYLVIRMIGYEVHPVVCNHYYPGYFTKMVKLCLKDAKIDVKETKCFFAGDPYHEYRISWS